MTEDATSKIFEFEDSAIWRPPEGAAPDRATVQFAARLLGSGFGQLSEVTETRLSADVLLEVPLPEITDNRVVTAERFSLAESTPPWLVATVPAVTAKVADEAPAGIESEAGTDNVVRFEDNATTTPPVGAGPDNVAVQFAL